MHISKYIRQFIYQYSHIRPISGSISAGLERVSVIFVQENIPIFLFLFMRKNKSFCFYNKYMRRGAIRGYKPRVLGRNTVKKYCTAVDFQ